MEAPSNLFGNETALFATHLGEVMFKGALGKSANGHANPGMHFRVANHADTSAVVGVLSAAALQLIERGQALWGAAEVSVTAVAPHIERGLYHVGFDGECAVGVFRLQFQDPVFWPEIPEGTSAHLHKLAVLPEKQGRGFAHELLHHAVALAREKHLQFLRLDCVAGRPKLRAVYESFGFRHPGQKQIGGGMFDRFEFELRGPYTSSRK